MFLCCFLLFRQQYAQALAQQKAAALNSAPLQQQQQHQQQINLLLQQYQALKIRASESLLPPVTRSLSVPDSGSVWEMQNPSSQASCTPNLQQAAPSSEFLFLILFSLFFTLKRITWSHAGVGVKHHFVTVTSVGWQQCVGFTHRLYGAGSNHRADATVWKVKVCKGKKYSSLLNTFKVTVDEIWIVI